MARGSGKELLRLILSAGFLPHALFVFSDLFLLCTRPWKCQCSCRVTGPLPTAAFLALPSPGWTLGGACHRLTYRVHAWSF